MQAVRFAGKRLTQRLSGDKSKLVIDLPPELAANEGVRFRDITYTDQSKYRYEIDVIAKKP